MSGPNIMTQRPLTPRELAGFAQHKIAGRESRKAAQGKKAPYWQTAFGDVPKANARDRAEAEDIAKLAWKHGMTIHQAAIARPKPIKGTWVFDAERTLTNKD